MQADEQATHRHKLVNQCILLQQKAPVIKMSLSFLLVTHTEICMHLIRGISEHNCYNCVPRENQALQLKILKPSSDFRKGCTCQFLMLNNHGTRSPTKSATTERQGTAVHGSCFLCMGEQQHKLQYLQRTLPQRLALKSQENHLGNVHTYEDTL